MRGKIYTFICETHEEFGCKGWKQEGVPGADPLGGMGVAHDVLELSLIHI